MPQPFERPVLFCACFAFFVEEFRRMFMGDTYGPSRLLK